MKENKERIMTVEVDPENLPAPTKEQLKELEILFSQPDSEIDYSDIPDKDMRNPYRPGWGERRKETSIPSNLLTDKNDSGQHGTV